MTTSDNNAIIPEPPAVTQVTHDGAQNGPVLEGDSAPNYGKDLNSATIPKQSRPHNYTSTACQHGLHERCRQRCKFCGTPCRCECHLEEADA